MATRFSTSGRVKAFMIKKVAILLNGIIIFPLLENGVITWGNFELQHDVDRLQRQQTRSAWMTLSEDGLSFESRENF